MLLSQSAVPSMRLVHSGSSPQTPASFGPLVRGRPMARPQQQQVLSWTSPNVLLPPAHKHVSPFRSQPMSSDSEGEDDPRVVMPPNTTNTAATNGNERTSSAERNQTPVSPTSTGRSILTMLLERERNDSTASDTTVIAREATATAYAREPSAVNDASQPQVSSGLTSPPSSGSGSSQDEVPTPHAILSTSPTPPSQFAFPTTSSSTPQTSSLNPANAEIDGRTTPLRVRKGSAASQRRRIPDEESGTAPLLGRAIHPSYGGTSPISISDGSPPHHAYTSPHPGVSSTASKQVAELYHTAAQYATPKAFVTGVTTTIQTLPAVMLGMLLNILDGVSYGFIIFPAGTIFAGFGSMGVSMFFVTCVIYTAFLSILQFGFFVTPSMLAD